MLIILTWFCFDIVSGINLLFFFSFFGLTFSVLIYLIYMFQNLNILREDYFRFLTPIQETLSIQRAQAISNGGFLAKE